MPTYEFFNNSRFAHMCQLLSDVASAEQVYGHFARLEAHLVHDRGDLDRQRGIIDPNEIERAARWYAHPGRLLAALYASELITEHDDGRVILRGWAANAPRFVKMRLQRLASERVRDSASREDRSETTFPEIDNHSEERRTTAHKCATGAQRRTQSQSQSQRDDSLSAPLQCQQCQSVSPKKNKSVSSRKIRTGAAGTGKAKAESEVEVEAETEVEAKAISERTKAGVLSALESAQLSIEQLDSWGPYGLHILLDAVGVDDSGFRVAVANTIRHHPEQRATLVELCGSLYAKKGTIRSPGAWLRRALERRGLTI